MRNIIDVNVDTCIGCNKCLRVCPVEEANISYLDGRGDNKVRIDSDKCIACGECVRVCRHNSRFYHDDTRRFFSDLEQGEKINLIVAPAVRVNFGDMGRLLAWFKQKGVTGIYDVSLGADICTWAHIRYIQQNPDARLITQPCPAIVNYVLKHHPELVKNLSPVHSPMLCTAIYMKKHEKLSGKIAALSPCVAKSFEFERTGNIVDYNVTFADITRYLEQNNVQLPAREAGFDHYQSALGGLYSMPGGLKENVEFFLGNGINIFKAEGHEVVYKELDAYAKTNPNNLPVVFDVLNCTQGCDVGTGTMNDNDIFTINSIMSSVRKNALKNRDKAYFENLYKTYDAELKLSDYLRSYPSISVSKIPYSTDAVNKAYLDMHKMSEEDRNVDCGACGRTCNTMAIRIAKGIDVPTNCLHAAYGELHNQKINLHQFVIRSNNDTKELNDKAKDIGRLVVRMREDLVEIQASVAEYEKMSKELAGVSTNIYMISINAGIEAARAEGRAGKAFKVVADEIKSLTRSTKETLDNAGKHAEESREAVMDLIKDFDLVDKDITVMINDIKDIFMLTKTIDI